MLSYRQRFGVTLPELSSESGIPLSVLEEIELGNLAPDKNVLAILSLYFNENFELKLFDSEAVKIHPYDLKELTKKYEHLIG